MAVRGTGVLAGFVVMLLIGRWYGPQANGQYAIVSQTAMFLSIVAVGGLDLAITREFSRAVAEQRKLALGTLLRTAGQALGIALLFVGALLWGGKHIFELLGRDAVPAGSIGVLCVILLARTLTRILAAVLRSQEQFLLGQSVEVLLVPLGTIVLLALGLARTVSEILWATAAAGVASAMIGFGSSLRHTSRSSDAMAVPAATLFATALPLWGAAISQNLSDWYGLATVTAVGGAYEAGLFRVAAQFAMVFSLVSTGLFGTFATQISTAFHAGDRARVAALAATATRLSGVLMAPFAVGFILFAPDLMGVIGPEFREGSTLMRVLVVGQVAIALASPAGLVLALTGHSRANFIFTAGSALFMLVTAPFAAQAWGAVGIAVLTSLALMGQNVAAFLFVRRFENMNAFTGRLLPSREVAR